MLTRNMEYLLYIFFKLCQNKINKIIDIYLMTSKDLLLCNLVNYFYNIQIN